jgi:hypothetical protein
MQKCERATPWFGMAPLSWLVTNRLELDTAHQLDVPGACDGTTPLPEVDVADFGIEVLAPTLRRACEICKLKAS